MGERPGSHRPGPPPSIMLCPSFLLSPAFHPPGNSRDKYIHVAALVAYSAALCRRRVESQLGRLRPRGSPSRAGAGLGTLLMAGTGLCTVYALALPCMGATGNPHLQGRNQCSGRSNHSLTWVAGVESGLEPSTAHHLLPLWNLM